MPLRVRKVNPPPVKIAPVKAAPPPVPIALTNVPSPVPPEEPEEPICVIADRLPCDICNVSISARAGNSGNKAYEDTVPLPNLRVSFHAPDTLDLICTQVPSGNTTIELKPSIAGTKSVVPVTITGGRRVWSERVTTNWTVGSQAPSQRIPRIIHQTYISRAMPAAGYRACQTWWLTNPEYEYRFYDDSRCQALMETWYAPDAPELQAYNLLYAGAYKSDIFRLALLLRVGGVWADVSSVCEAPLATYVNADDEMIVCVDSPCQKRYANIHQAYIYVIPAHPAIAHILEYTVSTVLNRRFETPGMVFQSIAVTGPTAFAEGLNDFLGRRPLEYFDPKGDIHLFKDDNISDNPFRFVPYVTEKGIRYLNHSASKIFVDADTVVISTKYPNFSKYRTNVHYSVLGNMGYVYKVQLQPFAFDQPTVKMPVWQIWLQTPYVSRQMASAMQTWHQVGDTYCFVTQQSARAATEVLLPEVWQAIDMVRPHAYKCDLLRAALLYLYGGLYVDADMVCLQSLAPLLQSNDILLLASGPEQVDNGIMYFARPGHPLLQHYLHRAVAQIKARVQVNSDLALTGPRLWTSCIFEYWNWATVPTRSARSPTGDRIAILTHAAVTPQYADSEIVTAAAFDEQRMKALRAVAPGTTVVTWADVPYVCTKYPDYNKERLVMGGTNFAAEFHSGAVYST